MKESTLKPQTLGVFESIRDSVKKSDMAFFNLSNILEKLSSRKIHKVPRKLKKHLKKKYGSEMYHFLRYTGFFSRKSLSYQKKMLADNFWFGGKPSLQDIVNVSRIENTILRSFNPCLNGLTVDLVFQDEIEKSFLKAMREIEVSDMRICTTWQEGWKFTPVGLSVDKYLTDEDIADTE